LAPGPGVLGTLPLSGAHGLVGALLIAAGLRSRLELVDQFEHRTVLALFAAANCQYWAATPVMVDLLSRCPLSGAPPRAPRVCTVGAGRLSEAVFHRFRDRFGVPPRPDYGSTENGTITASMGVSATVRPQVVGRPVPGVDVRIADDPRHPAPPGTVGPIWFRSGWRMEGYGFPPELDLPVSHGWSPTPDLGQLDDEGYLTLYGRADECFKTLSGHLVHPGEIVEALRSHPGVTDAMVLALNGPSGPAIGAVVEGEASVTAPDVRSHVAALLPPWKRPHALLVIPALPRLPRGKVDRLACAARLSAAAQEDT
jgi:long-chain acyl-CoA synthetase